MKLSERVCYKLYIYSVLLISSRIRFFKSQTKSTEKTFYELNFVLLYYADIKYLGPSLGHCVIIKKECKCTLLKVISN